MSPYAQELAHARLGALRELVNALNAAEDPAEKRRCAVAVFNAPDPCDIDDAIELEDDEAEHEEVEEVPSQPTPSVSEGPELPTSLARATGSPAALSGQPVPACNNLLSTPPLAPPVSPSPPAERATVGSQTRQRLAEPSPCSSTTSASLAHEMGEPAEPRILRSPPGPSPLPHPVPGISPAPS
jgi:hypothetical protein